MKMAMPAKLIGTALLCCAAGVAFAKLPPPSEEAKEKAAAAKAKSAEAAKKQHEALGKAMDRAVENYKRQHGGAEAMAPGKADAMAMKKAAPKKK